MKNIAIVTARSTSSRFPGKCFAPIACDMTAIEFVMRRAGLTGLDVVLATSDDASDDDLAALASRCGVEVFRGCLVNKVKRWHDCIQQHAADGAVMVDGDDLAFDYDIAKRAATALSSDRAELYAAPDNIVCGLFTYAFTCGAIESLFAAAPAPDYETDVITGLIRKLDLRTEIIALEPGEHDADVRLTLDYPEDAELFRAIYGRLPWDAAGLRIVKTVRDEGLWRINWHRQLEWQANQKRQVEEMDGR